MKKINLVLIGIIGLILLPIGVKASDNVTLSLGCDELILNKTQSCKLYADVASSHTLSGVNLKLELTNLTVDSFTKSEKFELSEVSDYAVNIVLISTSDLSGKVELGEFKLKASSKNGAKLTFKNAEYSIDEEVSEEETEPVEFDFKVKEAQTSGSTPGDSGSSDKEDKDDSTVKDSDCSLSSLSVENETINPKFKSDVYEYELKTNAKTITIKATSNSSKAKISGTGTKVVEDNKIYNVIVTAENGNKSTYKITVNKNTDGVNNKQNDEEKSNEENPNLGIKKLSVIMLLIIVGISGIIVFNKKFNLFKKI